VNHYTKDEATAATKWFLSKI